jgi:hypothetical protein
VNGAGAPEIATDALDEVPEEDTSDDVKVGGSVDVKGLAIEDAVGSEVGVVDASGGVAAVIMGVTDVNANVLELTAISVAGTTVVCAGVAMESAQNYQH